MNQLLGSVLLLLPFIAQAGDPEPVALVPGEVVVSHLANEGFLLQSGEQAVLIDAFLAEPYVGYPALPGAVLEDLESGEGVFGTVDVALASHAHKDHFQPGPARAFLDSVSHAVFASTPQVIQGFKDGYEGAGELADRLRVSWPDKGKWSRFEHRGIEVKVMQLSHGTGRFASMQNLGHLIHLGGMTILHVGDAAMEPANFQPFDLANQKIDVALLPYWYWGAAPGRKLIETQLKADHYVACHIPIKAQAQVAEAFGTDFPEVFVFAEALQSRTYVRKPALVNTKPPVGKASGK